jgi:hypothetical protein
MFKILIYILSTAFLSYLINNAIIIKPFIHHIYDEFAVFYDPY